MCLGATAAQALLGRSFRVTRERGTPVDSGSGAARPRDDPPVRDPARGRREARGRARGTRRRPQSRRVAPSRCASADGYPRRSDATTLRSSTSAARSASRLSVSRGGGSRLVDGCGHVRRRDRTRPRSAFPRDAEAACRGRACAASPRGRRAPSAARRVSSASSQGGRPSAPTRSAWRGCAACRAPPT